MSWHPADLVTDADLLAYEPKILTHFGQASWGDLRTKVLEDWLWPQLRGRGFDPARFRTRYAADAVCYGASYTDLTEAATDTTTDDLPLATIFASASAYLYVGSAQPFRGISLRITDAPSATAATLSVALWRDIWQSAAITDGTAKTSGVPLSGGGAITWTVPADWATRDLGTFGPYYWARIALSAVPTGATATQVSVIRRSLLCAPVTFRALALIFRGAPLNQAGPWEPRADWYEQEAERALDRAWPVLGGEFDTITEDDVVDADEQAQTPDAARGNTGWTYERA